MDRTRSILPSAGLSHVGVKVAWRGTMKRCSTRGVALVALVATLLLVPSAAVAFQITGGAGTQTQNGYGLWYAGQEACGIEGCHSSIVSKPSPHSNMVTDVKANPGALRPLAGSPLWPYSSPFGGLTINARDIYLQFGDGLGFHEYAGFQGSSIATGFKPLDDLPLPDPMSYLTGPAEFEAPATAVGARGYSSCSPCHNLGTTRPSDKSYTLPNGATMTSTTPVTVAELSIQCEVCHGTGKNPNGHRDAVPEVVGGTQILKAQVCGQCHVTGTTPQKNLAGSAFGNPNGYTTDATLSAYLTPYTTVESAATFMNYLNNGGAKPKFLPNGDDYSMRHDYYNEWLISAHAAPTNSHVQSSSTSTLCLRCHSGLGFLYRIDARSPQGTRIVPTQPTISQVATADPGISCQVCHTGHVGYTATGYDSKRRWGNGTEVSCGDCHNWQFEQLNQPLQYETIAGAQYSRPALNTRVRHPSREMVSGGRGGDDGTGGMWGVDPMGQYMPGVRCQDCHMPRTHKEGMPANDDGSTDATRMSHRFHIVYPGDAITWRLRPGGDSCDQPGCHTAEAAGWSRGDFQSWIDAKTAQVASASADASTALTAAAADAGLTSYTSFIAAQPTTVTVYSAAQWSMLQHAAQNLDFVALDASRGLHNPDYALAGLRKAEFWADSAAATVSASIDPVGNGEGMTVTGSLLGAHGVIPGAKVVLQKSTDGGSTWSFVATGTPDSTGAFSVDTGRIIGTTVFRVAFMPDSANTVVSAPMSVAVPVTVASLSPAAAADGWIDAPSVVTSLAVTPGASVTFYSLSGATMQAQTIYTGPFAITSPGETLVTFYSSNADGVEAVQTQRVLIDRDLPAFACDAVSTYRDSATVRFSASDISGLSLFTYSLDGAPANAGANGWAALSVTQPGAHSLTVQAVDGAGHPTSRTWAFTAKATPHFRVLPSAYSSSVRRGRSWSSRVTVVSALGVPVGRASVYLQRSYNGRSWSTVARLTANASGQASKSVRMSTTGTTYWRWYVPSQTRAFAGASGKKRVVVR